MTWGVLISGDVLFRSSNLSPSFRAKAWDRQFTFSTFGSFLLRRFPYFMGRVFSSGWQLWTVCSSFLCSLPKLGSRPVSSPLCPVSLQCPTCPLLCARNLRVPVLLPTGPACTELWSALVSASLLVYLRYSIFTCMPVKILVFYVPETAWRKSVWSFLLISSSGALLSSSVNPCFGF